MATRKKQSPGKKTRAFAKTSARAKKVAAKAKQPRASAARALAAGPVTLEEAQLLAQATSPRRALRRATSTVVEPTPASVGAEREQLAVKRRQEARDRIKEYRATLTIMKQRGAAAPRRQRSATPGAQRARALAARAVVSQPLQILAEGDSWFDYPVPFFGGGIIRRLVGRLGIPILNLAKAGDEVRYMLGVEERVELIEQLTRGCPAGGDWDVLLFSGGGNDIVDNPMALWIKDFDPAVPIAQNIHQPRLDAAFTLIRAGYEDLIALRDSLSPGTHLFFHAYDFPIPDGRGACHFGPWLKPTFDLRKFPSRSAAAAVVKEMLTQFAALLAELAATHARVTFINGQGTLAPNPASWHNELHPAKPGFDKFAELFHGALKRAFPGRVF